MKRPRFQQSIRWKSCALVASLAFTLFSGCATPAATVPPAVPGASGVTTPTQTPTQTALDKCLAFKNEEMPAHMRAAWDDRQLSSATLKSVCEIFERSGFLQKYSLREISHPYEGWWTRTIWLNQINAEFDGTEVGTRRGLAVNMRLREAGAWVVESQFSMVDGATLRGVDPDVAEAALDRLKEAGWSIVDTRVGANCGESISKPRDRVWAPSSFSAVTEGETAGFGTCNNPTESDLNIRFVSGCRPKQGRNLYLALCVRDGVVVRESSGEIMQ